MIKRKKSRVCIAPGALLIFDTCFGALGTWNFNIILKTEKKLCTHLHCCLQSAIYIFLFLYIQKKFVYMVARGHKDQRFQIILFLSFATGCFPYLFIQFGQFFKILSVREGLAAKLVLAYLYLCRCEGFFIVGIFLRRNVVCTRWMLHTSSQ